MIHVAHKCDECGETLLSGPADAIAGKGEPWNTMKGYHGTLPSGWAWASLDDSKVLMCAPCVRAVKDAQLAALEARRAAIRKGREEKSLF